MADNIHIRILLIRQHLGHITPDEQHLLEQYLATDQEARELQKEVQSLSKDEMLGFTTEFDINAGLEGVLEKEREYRQGKYRSLSKRIAAAVAAAFIIGCSFYYIFTSQSETPSGRLTQGDTTYMEKKTVLTLGNGRVLNLDDSGYQQVVAGNTRVNNNNRFLKFDQVSGMQETDMERWNTLTVPARLDYQIELTDGTIVWLNSLTKFRFPFIFSGNFREVYIDQGEAYFQVSPNSTRPFIVHTRHGEIRVVGTEFNVNTYAVNQVITSLVKGKVSINSGIDRKELSPGLEAITEPGKAISTQPFDPAITLSWKQGIHYFNDAPITAVALMLERWFNTPLTIDNSKAGNTRFRGRLYRQKPLQYFIDQMNLTKDVTFYWEDGKLHCK